MDMTRLALCLLCLAIVFALPTLGYFFSGLSFLATDDVAVTFSRHWRLGVLFLATPIVGLCILLLVRPEDLLRWTPIGDAGIRQGDDSCPIADEPHSGRVDRCADTASARRGSYGDRHGHRLVGESRMAVAASMDRFSPLGHQKS